MLKSDPTHSLFNEKTIQRLCSDVTVTSKQRNSAKDWLEMLKSGSLTEEKSNYFKFAIYVLQDILGYSVKEKLKFEEGNVEFSFRNSDGIKGVCIEVKGTSTKDLFSQQHRTKAEHETPIKQTWDYMGSGDFDYGISTNYDTFVLIDRSKGYSKYHIFDFTDIENDEMKFKEFIAIFSKENILDKNFISHLYEQSLQEEREFTKEFYKLFHETRLMLIKEFQSGANVSKQEAIHFAQIFLNRLIFLFFAEDTGKVRKRLFFDSVWQSLNPLLLSEYSQYVCDTIRNLLARLNEGSHRPIEIFGFNGGLFSEVIPAKISFKDIREESFFKDVLQYSKLKKQIQLDEGSQSRIIGLDDLNSIIKNFLLMSSFNFESELNVNILGNIFEQSLTDLEELEYTKFEDQHHVSSTRKKEGIFYTPQYITEYICRNSIIPYLSKSGTNSVTELIDEYSNDIEQLEQKFNNLKILDPACGSGAFLLKVVDILLEIYKHIQVLKESKGKYTISKKNKKSGFTDIFTLTKWSEEQEARKIIENNIYGVDINEESVEITRLSLFLKIASHNRKLLDLSKNIKIGDSLISDERISTRAFDWNKEFKDVMLGGGFDLVLGNPPYVRQEQITSIKPYLEANYPLTFSGVADLYVFFIDKGVSLLKENGLFSIIVSNKFTKAKYAEKLRNHLLKFDIKKFVDFRDLPVFHDTSTYPCILTLQKRKGAGTFLYYRVENLQFDNLDQFLQGKQNLIQYSSLSNNGWNFEDRDTEQLLSKIRNSAEKLGEFVRFNFYRGITTGFNDAFVISEDERRNLIAYDNKSKELIFPYLSGKEIKRYKILWERNYIIFTRRGITISDYPAIFNHLEKFRSQLMPKKSQTDKVGRKPGRYQWYEIQDSTDYWKLFLKESIIYPHFNRYSSFTLSPGGFFSNNKTYLIDTNDRFLLGVLNSKLMNFCIRSICPYVKGGYYEYISEFIENLPITKDRRYEKEIIENVNSILQSNITMHEIKENVKQRIRDNLKTKITQKLALFYDLPFSEFLIELRKQKVNLSLDDQDKWQDYILRNAETIKELLDQIEIKDNEINNLVYASYSLGPREIKIIEDSLRNL